MHYVKQFKINGVDTKQVACIELQGVPNAATEGSVGVLGMDMSSPTHEVYRCVAVNGNVYTWELLSAGMSIISATITGEGGESKSFPYENLRIPNNYLIKVGDLILDSEGYLYQITSIGAKTCDTTYCGTHIGGIASGDKDYSLTVVDGKLQMVTESGAIISDIDYSIPDETTICRDSSTGAISAYGIKTINDTALRLFVGEQAEYDLLTDDQKQNLFAIITDDPTLEALKKKKHTVIKELYSGGGNNVIDRTVPAETSIVTRIDNSNGAPLYYQIAIGVESFRGEYWDTLILPHSLTGDNLPQTRFYKEGAASDHPSTTDNTKYGYIVEGLIACEGSSDYVQVTVKTDFNPYTTTPRIYIYGVYEE